MCGGGGVSLPVCKVTALGANPIRIVRGAVRTFELVLQGNVGDVFDGDELQLVDEEKCPAHESSLKWAGNPEAVDELQDALLASAAATEVRLDGVGLSRLPAAPATWRLHAASLHTLNLNGNALSELPAAIGTLGCVRRLALEEKQPGLAWVFYKKLHVARGGGDLSGGVRERFIQDCLGGGAPPARARRPAAGGGRPAPRRGARAKTVLKPSRRQPPPAARPRGSISSRSPTRSAACAKTVIVD